MVDSREQFEKALAKALAKAMRHVCAHSYTNACDGAPVHTKAFSRVMWEASRDAAIEQCVAIAERDYRPIADALRALKGKG